MNICYSKGERNTYRNKSGVLRRTLILEPLTQAADGDTGGLPDGGIGILETGLDDRPDFVHERSHELAAPFNANSKRKNGTTTVAWVRRSEVLNNEGTEGGEDLSGGQVGGESIDDAQSGLDISLILRGDENQRD